MRKSASVSPATGFTDSPVKFPWRGLGILGILIAGLIVLSQTFVIVQAGERAVIFSDLSGVQKYQLAEGFHLNLPMVWHITKYDIKTRTYTMSGSTQESNHTAAADHDAAQVPDDSLTALTADGLPVTLDLSVRFHIDPNNVWRLHKEIGKDYISKIIRPELRSHTRIAIAEFPADRVYSAARETIQANMEARLREKLAHNYIVVDEVLMRSISFSDAYQNAIIQKQIAQQNAQRMQYVLAKEQQEKRRKIIQAEGEAESIRLKGQAIATNPKVVAYQYVQKVAPNIKTVLSSGDIPVPSVGTNKP